MVWLSCGGGSGGRGVSVVGVGCVFGTRELVLLVIVLKLLLRLLLPFILFAPLGYRVLMTVHLDLLLEVYCIAVIRNSFVNIVF